MELLSTEYDDGAAHAYQYTPLPGSRTIRALKLWPLLEPSKDGKDPSGGDGEHLAEEDTATTSRLEPIQCSLIELDLDAEPEPEYVALSYVWGDPKVQTTIYIDGQPMKATVNLEAALRDLRVSNMHCLIWADAICINQADVAERSAQVQMMADIYRRATRVCIWLGSSLSPHDLGSYPSVRAYMNKTFELFDDRSAGGWGSENPEDSEEDSDDEIHQWGAIQRFIERALARAKRGEANFFEHDWEPFKRIMRLPWFRRKWVFQEAVLARQDPEVIIGRESIPFSRLAELCYPLILGLADYIVATDEASQAEAIKTSAHICEMIRGFRKKLCDAVPSPLLNLIFVTRNLKCWEPRDHIYALAGIATDTPPKLRVDYSCTPAESFADMARLQIVDRKDFTFLSIGYDPEIGRRDGLPSWVPNLAAMLYGFASLTTSNVSIYCAGARLAAEPILRLSDDNRTLFVTGVVLPDRITSVVPNVRETMLQADPPSSTQDLVRSRIRHGREWFGMCLQLAVGSEEPLTSLDGISPAAWDAFSRTMVCGRTVTGNHAPAELPDLMRRFWRLMSLLSQPPPVGVHRGEGDLGVSMAIDGALASNSGGRRFFVTETGRLGQATLTARPGDEIFVAVGAQVPFVVRRTTTLLPETGAAAYEFVGECYLDGVMNGEAYDGEDVELQEIGLM
ncbi:hypothetical protein NEMBOFW57_005518 [Staphylotrichum longicolle]|uniref:Heterokaryon incompatibility domain-containing protein n=1 Tax=Staphylotrichum longicolle TaxID=669026 RepID=A0AAD4I0D1_9PEZI|nr:hypothetical protein NEMBOFW57_005518 [Staphylotrichum longicolle]